MHVARVICSLPPSFSISFEMPKGCFQCFPSEKNPIQVKQDLSVSVPSMWVADYSTTYLDS